LFSELVDSTKFLKSNQYKIEKIKYKNQDIKGARVNFKNCFPKLHQGLYTTPASLIAHIVIAHSFYIFSMKRGTEIKYPQLIGQRSRATYWNGNCYSSAFIKRPL